MERLSSLDSAFLHLEDTGSPLHIGSVAILEGPVPSQAAIRHALVRKLPLVPRYRQRVRRVPLSLGRPVWVDVTSFDVDYHLRRTALPAPGGPAELRELVERVMSQPLDRDLPLWESWVVEGLEEGRWALLTKVHHSMVDGIAGTDLLGRVLDSTPDPDPVPDDDWSPRAAPSGLVLLAGAVEERLLDPVTDLFALAGTLRHPRSLAERALETGRGLLGFAGGLVPVRSSSLQGHVGHQRRYRWAQVPIPEVLDVRAGLGGTVNDVVLAAVSLAFRDLLLGRGESRGPRAVRTLVPVSVRSADQRGRDDNRVSAILADLPVDVGDPVDCLHEVSRRMIGLKATHEAEAGETVTALADLLPPPGVALTLTAAARFPQRVLTTVTTNVPGPRGTLYLCGRRMLATYPYVPIADRLRVGIAVTSYDGSLLFGMTGDRETTADLDVLADGLVEAFALLHKAALETAAQQGPPR